MHFPYLILDNVWFDLLIGYTLDNVWFDLFIGYTLDNVWFDLLIDYTLDNVWFGLFIDYTLDNVWFEVFIDSRNLGFNPLRRPSSTLVVPYHCGWRDSTVCSMAAVMKEVPPGPEEYPTAALSTSRLRLERDVTGTVTAEV